MKIGIIGFGNMGSAIHASLIKKFPAKDIYICDKTSKKTPQELFDSSDVVILAVKPQDFESLAKTINSKKQPLVLSIMAGTTISKIQKLLKSKRVVRAMPNIGAKVGSSVTGWFSKVSSSDKKIAREILSSFGMEFEVKKEEMLNTVTSLSGCGPGYFAYFGEIIAETAIKFGIGELEAQNLTKQTLIGTSKLIESSNINLTDLKNSVASKGGSTQAALKYFAENNLDKIIFRGIEKAKNRFLPEKKETSWLTNKLNESKDSENILLNLSQKIIDKCLMILSCELLKKEKEILEANTLDLNEIDKENPIYDRVKLNHDRIKEMADALKIISKMVSPIDEIIEERTLENGLNLKKVRVPFGLVAVIFEGRPNVTIDVFALSFKTKNISVLKCGKEAYRSSQIFVKIIQQVLRKNKLPEFFCLLLPTDRDTTFELLKANKYIDVLIPRGGPGLINWVRENSRIPLLETGAGVVHIYFDKDGDVGIGEKIIFNAKTRRPSVCNTVDTLIVHEDRLKDLPHLVKSLEGKNVEIFADSSAFKVLKNKYPYLREAEEKHFGYEFLSLKMAIKTVSSFPEAISHINHFGSKHSESIITKNLKTAEKFLKNVDASTVYHNVSTAFTDGGQFGMGSEIGISTQKLHARGPMALKELTSYKWVVRGKGQVRS